MNDRRKMNEQRNGNVEKKTEQNKTESWKRKELKRSRNGHRIRDRTRGKESRNRQIKKSKVEIDG